SQDLPRIDTSGRIGFAALEAQRQADYQRDKKLQPLDENILAASDTPVTEEGYLVSIRELLKRSDATNPGPDSRRTILWLGNRGEHRESQARALTEAGCEVELAASAEAALEALNKRHHGLVISDLGSGPESSAGWEILSKLRTSPPAPGSQTLPW